MLYLLKILYIQANFPRNISKFFKINWLKLGFSTVALPLSARYIINLEKKEKICREICGKYLSIQALSRVSARLATTRLTLVYDQRELSTERSLQGYRAEFTRIARNRFTSDRCLMRRDGFRVISVGIAPNKDMKQ